MGIDLPPLMLIETSGRVGLVGVAAGPALVAERRLDETRRHARDLAPTAAELLRRHGSLEGVIAHALELTPRQRESIGEHADELRSYREVATMRRDVPLPDLTDRAFDPQSAAAWCLERGITHLAKRLTTSS